MLLVCQTMCLDAEHRSSVKQTRVQPLLFHLALTLSKQQPIGMAGPSVGAGLVTDG